MLCFDSLPPTTRLLVQLAFLNLTCHERILFLFYKPIYTRLLINLIHYSTDTFCLTVQIRLILFYFQTLFTYKETILFCPNKFFFLFTATLWPFLSSLPFFFSRTSHRGCQVKARRQARNILAQLCFALDDSQHYRSLGVDASFSTIPG